MNPYTGEVYRGADEITAARERGEPVVEISPEVVRMLEAGQREIARRRARNKQAKRSRKANR